MNQVVGAILVALIGGSAGVVGAWLNSRGQKTQARNSEAANVFEAYDELNANLRASLREQAEEHRRELDAQRNRFTDELAGYLERLQRAAAELEACEARCEECRRGMAELLATLGALRAVVVDEVAKAAADRAFETHSAGINPADIEKADVASLRRFLEHLGPLPPPAPKET